MEGDEREGLLGEAAEPSSGHTPTKLIVVQPGSGGGLAGLLGGTHRKFLPGRAGRSVD